MVNLAGYARGRPGQDLPQSDSPIVWDMGVCHDCAPRAFARRSRPARTGRRRVEHRRPCLGPAYADAPVRPGPADPASITAIRVPADAGVAPWAIAAPGAPSIVPA